MANIIAVTPSLTSEIGIDKSDLIAIKVAKVETDLMNQQAEGETKLRALKKDLKSVEDRLTVALKEVESSYPTNNAINALKALGFASLSVKVHVSLIDKNEMMKVEVSISEDGRYRDISTSQTVPITPTVRNVNQEIKDLQSKIDEQQISLIEIRKRLSQIGMVERQAKAQLALATMQTSEAGRALIAEMDKVEGLPKIC